MGLRIFWRRLRFRAVRRAMEADLHSEMQQHLALLTDDLIAQGNSGEQARLIALRRFGNQRSLREESRESWGFPSFESFVQDLRFGVRLLARSPGFAIVAVLTLALGIGANSALFTVVNAALLKPLPVKDPKQLVLMVWDTRDSTMQIARNYEGSATSDYSPTGNLEGTSFPYLAYERLRVAKETFASVFAFVPIEQLNLIVDGSAEVASGQYVSGDYYRGVGVDAWRGRLLTDADDKPGAPPAAVITWRYWQRRFGGEASAVGKRVIINQVPFVIVGVSPPPFAGVLELGESADVSIPLSTDPLVHPENSALAKPGVWWLRMMARLHPGVTRAQAQARVDAVFQSAALDAWEAGAAANNHTAGSAPTTAAPTVFPHLLLTSGKQGDEFARRRYRQPLAVLMGVVGLVLLIACINVANLLLARSSARQQEFAMRVALGASRWRLVRQLVTESLLLSTMAGVAGVLAAIWGKDLLLRWSAWIRGGLSIQAGIDARVLCFTAAISLLTGLVFALAPAVRTGGAVPGVRQQIGNPAPRRALIGKLLIVTQVAASLVLIVASGLFLRTLRNLHSVETGFDTRNVMLFRVRPESNGYSTTTVGPLYDRMIEQIRGIPAVKGVSLSRHSLLSFTHLVLTVYTAPGDPNNGNPAEVNVVSPSFFETMQVPVILGRQLRQSDTQAAEPVVIVNQTFVRKYFGNQNPIGQQFWLGSGGEGTGNPLRVSGMTQPNSPPMQIVGIARDAKYTTLRDEVKPTVYRSYQQWPSLEATFEVRYSGNTSMILPGVRAAVQQADPRLPIFDVRSQDEQAETSVGEEAMFAKLSALMGTLALVLAAVGLFGIMSYAVGRRTREIGVRMALGAQQSAVLMMVLRECLVLFAAGIVVGIPLALACAHAASSVLSDLLFGVNSVDPLSVVSAVVTLILVALLAGYLPARQAAGTDPVMALRSE